MSTAYNYERFDAYVESGEDEREFGAFPNMLHAGDRAPDGEVTLLDGERSSHVNIPATTGTSSTRAKRIREST